MEKKESIRATGPGELPFELIKYATTRALKLLCVIFDKYRQGKRRSTDWKISYKCSTYIEGNRNGCINYRGTTISSCSGKFYEKLLKGRIQKEAACRIYLLKNIQSKKN